MPLKINDKGWNRIKAELALCKKSYTKVGLPSDGKVGAVSSPKSDLHKYYDMSEVATVAAFQEFGTSQVVTPKQAAFLNFKGFNVKVGTIIKTPKREFVSTSFDENLESLKIMVDNLYNQILEGRIGTIMALKILGEFGVAKMKLKIQQITTPPLHPFTIKNKKSSKPLIDTGQTINSIQHTEIIL
jgi:hypothetical protein